MPREKKQSRKIRVTYAVSSIGCSKQQKATIRALGLRRLGDVTEHEDSPIVRGMVDKVKHLVQLEVV